MSHTAEKSFLFGGLKREELLEVWQLLYLGRVRQIDERCTNGDDVGPKEGSG